MIVTYLEDSAKLRNTWRTKTLDDKFLKAEREGCIGYATLLDDGTIELDLCSDGAMSLLRYELAHERYSYILDHVGPLEVNQAKMVKPFP